nr:immunoglobulin heavy chain junction region [Mus musculus]
CARDSSGYPYYAMDYW